MATTADPAASADAAPAPDRMAARKRAFAIFAAVLGALALAYAGYQLLFGGRYVETDNAYVGAEVGQVTPLVGGPVARVLVTDTQAVKAGDLLIQLDDADARLAVTAAQADVARAERQVRGTLATGTALAAGVDATAAAAQAGAARLEKARADLARARTDLARRQALIGDGAVSGEELTNARTAFAAATAAVEQASADLAQLRAQQANARGTRSANAALTAGTTVETHPDVLAARAKLEQARLELARTQIRAPFDGVVAGRQVEVGQRVAPGAVLMRVVPLSRVYVDANFKENQLRRVRPGQPVELVSDLYGDDVVYHGRVVGFSGGTGAAFALIPAQNASGNWIKVVQRVPVRVALNADELRAHPLRVGLSMVATVDTGAAR